MKLRRALVVIVALGTCAPLLAQTPLGTAFTYQGRLTDAGGPATGSFDFQLRLYDAPTGLQVGSTLSLPAVPVASGLFTVSLDFGSGAFGPNARWLEIAVRPAGGGAYTTLSPRQRLTPTPGALFSAAAAVTPWTGISGVPAGFADGIDNDVLGGLSCASGQVAKWNGAAWACAADADTIGWGLTGNAGTNPATNFIGTTDSAPLELRVSNHRALRLERATTTVGTSTYLGQNVLSGDAGNSITAGVTMATIAGGGGTWNSTAYPNRVTNVGGTVAGGWNN